MSKYIRNYDNVSAYNNDTARPKDKSVVSKTGNDVKYDPVNVIIPYRSSFLQVGDMPIYDRIDKERKILKMQTVDSIANIDSTRYVLSDSFYVCSEFGNDYFAYKKAIGTRSNDGNGGVDAEQWAANCQYKLTLDLTANGGFNYSYTQNGSAVTGSVSWSAGDGIESVIAAINKNTFTKVDANNIQVSWTSYSGDTLTLSNDTGVTLLDCSLSARIGANGTPFNQHKGFQTTVVKTLFPTIDYMSATTSAYTVNGYESSYRTCVNFTTYVNYFSTNGTSTFTAETSIETMKRSVFEACGESQVAAEKALYDKYNGNYEAYCAAKMPDYRANRGVLNSSYGKALDFTKSLGEIYFTNPKGETTPAYPAANKCHTFGIETQGITTGFEAGNWCLSNASILCRLKSNEYINVLNPLIAKVSGGGAVSLRYSWCVGEYIASTGWYFLSYNGTLINRGKYYSFRVRPFLALPSI